MIPKCLPPIEPQRTTDQCKPLNISIWVAYRHLSLNLIILKLTQSHLSPFPFPKLLFLSISYTSVISINIYIIGEATSQGVIVID